MYSRKRIQQLLAPTKFDSEVGSNATFVKALQYIAHVVKRTGFMRTSALLNVSPIASNSRKLRQNPILTALANSIRFGVVILTHSYLGLESTITMGHLPLAPLHHSRKENKRTKTQKTQKCLYITTK